MSRKSVTDLYTAALEKTGSSPKELKAVLSELREAEVRAVARTGRAVWQIFVLGCVWFLVWTANIKDVQIAGTKIANAEVLLLVIPVALAFLYYRYHCLQAHANLLDSAIREIFPKVFPRFADAGLVDLIGGQSSVYFEAVLYQLDTSETLLSRSALAWTVTLYVGLAASPLALLGFMLWAIWAGGSAPVVWLAIASGLAGLLALRAVVVFFYSSDLI